MRKPVLSASPGESHDAAIGRSRIGRMATVLTLGLLLCAQGWGGAEAKTRAQCETDSKACNRKCGLPSEGWPSMCTRTCNIIWKQCECDGGRKSFCEGGTDNPKSPDVREPKNVPRGPGSVGTPPKSHTPDKPWSPGSVGTPPKSNPVPPVKPRGPGNVTAPKSSSPSAGPGLRSGGSHR